MSGCQNNLKRSKNAKKRKKSVSAREARDFLGF